MHLKGQLGGTWGITIIMVILVSWFIYRYLAPRNFREWRNLGLVQAFIVALYAEMYGFPLTIYILTYFFDFDIPWIHFKGHLWSSLLGLGEEWAMIEMIVGFAFVFAGLSLIMRGWKQIYEARKEDRLVIDGLYQYMRHPQYTGIYLTIFGQIIHWPTIPTITLFPFIVWAYYHLARKEEMMMIEKLDDEYRKYMEKVPMFFPRKDEWRKVFFESEESGDLK
ncbi:MAG: isoprenylcysteine carboxylmethyltransferase family protein [bacterium]|nr:isoprenylcysteine carboxylmethyltransferase family protein [bacterium]